jgi:hypothetical protein
MKKYLFLLLLVGCADVRPESTTLVSHDLDAEKIESSYKNIEIPCGKETCESKKEYCLRSTKDYESNIFLPATCAERPAGCGDCTCMRKDAQNRFKGSTNCKGEIHCSQEDSKLVVTCVPPPKALEP